VSKAGVKILQKLLIKIDKYTDEELIKIFKTADERETNYENLLNERKEIKHNGKND